MEIIANTPDFFQFVVGFDRSPASKAADIGVAAELRKMALAHAEGDKVFQKILCAAFAASRHGVGPGQ
jgi:hypothetical protein